jgi:hypothetical protein
MKIFIYARSSSRRIQPQSVTVQTADGNIQQAGLRRRDAHLLRHIIFMFCIFVVGWGPIHLVEIVIYYCTVDTLVVSLLFLLAQVCTLSLISNLYLYNHEVRRWLQSKLLPCF